MKYIYTAVFSIGDDGKVYARVPDLPGCISTGKIYKMQLIRFQMQQLVGLLLQKMKDFQFMKQPPKKTFPTQKMTS